MDLDEARTSLSTVTTARRQTIALRGYRQTGSIVAAWGVAWLCGFSVLQFAPVASPWVWMLANIGALTWTLTRPANAHDFRSSLSWLVAIAGLIVVVVVSEADYRTAAMLSAIFLAAGYLLVGIWAGRRFALLGAMVALAAATGWWLVPDWLFLALALGGGAALIIGGLWLRRP